MEITNILPIQTRRELREWLCSNHAASSHAWVPVLSKAPEELSYLAIVEESICFGWIDSTKKRQNGMTFQRISPRRKSSNWTELNKERARRLSGMGLMTEHGCKSLPDMSESAFAIRPDILAAINADPETRRNFSKLPPLYIRVKIDNIQAFPAGDQVYERRLAKFLANTKANQLYGDWNDNGRLPQRAEPAP